MSGAFDFKNSLASKEVHFWCLTNEWLLLSFVVCLPSATAFVVVVIVKNHKRTLMLSHSTAYASCARVEKMFMF
jgi:hypothetical protein